MVIVSALVSALESRLQPTVDMDIETYSVNNGVIIEEPKNTSPSIEAACNLVQRLLVQLTDTDSPPSNSGNNNDYNNTKEASKNSRQPPSPTQTSSDIERTTTQTSSIKSSSSHVTTHQNNKSQGSSSLQQQGHVALANLCASSLERLGKQPGQTIQLDHSLSERQEEHSISNTKSDSNKVKSQSFKWMKKKWRKNSPQATSTEDSDSCEGRDTSESHNTVSNHPEPVRLKMFGSEYARFLSTTPLAPNDVSAQTSKRAFLRRTLKHGIQNIEDTDSRVLTSPITDIIVIQGEEIPPKGYYRISQTSSGEQFLIKDRKSTMFICVKKETNWDRAAQRPCVTAISLIFPDRKEFVPPGFSLVRVHRSLPSSSSSTPTRSVANLNIGGSEPAYLCFRRSREGNPLTGILPLSPSRRESIPEGYTVLEKSPRNFVASLRASNVPIFLAYRQRLANLESLRPLPLVMSVLKGESNTTGLESYYCTGGTVVDSKVGRFHIMDRSTHSLLSPSSIKNRLTLIETSRQKSMSSIKDDHSHAIGEKYSYSGTSSVQNTTSPQKVLSASHISTMSDSDRNTSVGDFESVTSSSEASRSFSSFSQHNDSERSKHSCLNTKDKCLELDRCLQALSFIPTVSHASQKNDSKAAEAFQMRVAILIPVLTSCYTRHGGSALVAVEGLTDLLSQDFYVNDVDMSRDPSSQTTLLDLSIQVVCDVATMGAQETQLYACVEFVEQVSKSKLKRHHDVIFITLRYTAVTAIKTLNCLLSYNISLTLFCRPRVVVRLLSMVADISAQEQWAMCFDFIYLYFTLE